MNDLPGKVGNRPGAIMGMKGSGISQNVVLIRSWPGNDEEDGFANFPKEMQRIQMKVWLKQQTDVSAK
jgi:hypothetical protein